MSEAADKYAVIAAEQIPFSGGIRMAPAAEVAPYTELWERIIKFNWVELNQANTLGSPNTKMAPVLIAEYNQIVDQINALEDPPLGFLLLNIVLEWNLSFDPTGQLKWPVDFRTPITVQDLDYYRAGHVKLVDMKEKNDNITKLPLEKPDKQ